MAGNRWLRLEGVCSVDADNDVAVAALDALNGTDLEPDRLRLLEHHCALPQVEQADFRLGRRGYRPRGRQEPLHAAWASRMARRKEPPVAGSELKRGEDGVFSPDRSPKLDTSTRRPETWRCSGGNHYELSHGATVPSRVAW